MKGKQKESQAPKPSSLTESSFPQVWRYTTRTDMASVNTVIQRNLWQKGPFTTITQKLIVTTVYEKMEPSFIRWETFIHMQSVLPSALDKVGEVWGKERGIRLSCYVYQGMQPLAMFQHTQMKPFLWLTHQKKKLLCSSVQTHTSALTVPTNLKINA